VTSYSRASMRFRASDIQDPSAADVPAFGPANPGADPAMAMAMTMAATATFLFASAGHAG